MKIIVAAPDQTYSRVGGLRTQVERTAGELAKLGVIIEQFNPWKTYDFKEYDCAHIFSMNTPCYFKADLMRGNIPLIFSSVMWRTGSTQKIRLLVEAGIRSPHMVLNDVISCRLMSNWASGILPNTTAEAKWLTKAIGIDENKCAVVPNGADDHFSGLTYDDLDRLSNIHFDFDFVLCASVISSRKNLISLAKVCLKNNLPLVIAGPVVDNEVYTQIQKIKKQGGEIILLGKLENNSMELGYLYSKCRVFCLPSFYETPGIAALEAALRHAPIVITRVGGAEDYFLDMASYINPHDELDIESKLLAAWQKGREGSTSSILADRIKKEFSWKSVAQKTIDAYFRFLK